MLLWQVRCLSLHLQARLKLNGLAGHLVDCSGYATGGNFSGFDLYDLDMLVDLPFGIAEVDRDGTAIITKHENTNGIVTEEVVKCQFLYELQGAIYLNSILPENMSESTVADTLSRRCESRHH